MINEISEDCKNLKNLLLLLPNGNRSLHSSGTLAQDLFSIRRPKWLKKEKIKMDIYVLISNREKAKLMRKNNFCIV